MELFDTHFLQFGQTLALSEMKLLVIVSYKSPFRINGKITTLPRLIEEHLFQNENKYQIIYEYTH